MSALRDEPADFTVITGIDTMEILEQALEAARTFTPLSKETVATSTRPHRGRGGNRQIRTVQDFRADTTGRRTIRSGSAEVKAKSLMVESRWMMVGGFIPTTLQHPISAEQRLPGRVVELKFSSARPCRWWSPGDYPDWVGHSKFSEIALALQ